MEYQDPLRSRYVGDDFSDFAHPSLFGAFAMVVRLNHFEPRDYLSAFGLRVRRAEDLSRVLTFSQSRKRSIQAALGLPAATGELEPWLPFTCDTKPFEDAWEFRYCGSCLRVGFHTLLHQLPWIHRCPWHGDTLRVSCRRCDRPMAVDGSSGRPLLQCACGFEPLNETSALTGDHGLANRCRPILQDYLDWAAHRRSTCRLIAPPGLSTAPSVLAEIVRLPVMMRARCQNRDCLGMHHTGTLTTSRAPFVTDDLRSAIAKLEPIGLIEPGMIEVPAPLERAFLKVACDLANHLPEKTLSDSEMSLFFDGSERQPDGRFVPAHRRSIQDISWLPTRLVGSRRFLSLRCIDRKAVRVATDLLQLLQDGDGDGEGQAEDRTRWLTLRAVGRTLLRGYAEGLRTVIARHNPVLFDSKRDRPHLTEPWVIVDSGSEFRMLDWVWARATRLPD